MKIALDAMGGDHAPLAPLMGALEALKVLPGDDTICLVGKSGVIRDCLQGLGAGDAPFEIIEAPGVIGMDETPTTAFTQKRDASIPVGYQMMKQGKADAFLGAGNTGAMLVGAIYSLNTIPGIIRPAIPALVPRSKGGYTLILDVGSNPDARPDVLYQYALIGSLYANLMMGVMDPKVALLNIGEEEEKGNLLTQAAYRMMKGAQDFHFTGNIEARDLFGDTADVVVCDGFTGNVILKQIEGFYNLLMAHRVENPFFQRYNYENYGGTPVLGVNGIAMIAHGISSAQAFKTMFIEARKIFDAGLIGQLQDTLRRFID